MAIAQTRSRGSIRLALLAAALGSIALSGCGSVSEKFGQTLADAPAIGLPADVPNRPATQPAYPAVHDMPPARPAVMTADEQIKMEDELVKARNHQQELAGTTPPPPPPAPPAAKPKPAAVKAAQAKGQAKKKTAPAQP